MNQPVNSYPIRADVGSGSAGLAFPWFLKEDDVSGVGKGVQYRMANVVCFVLRFHLLLLLFSLLFTKSTFPR
jgi:hypothetical protein